MAINKAKRSIHLAQPARRSPNPKSNLSPNADPNPGPSPQPAAELMPVKAHVYRVIAEFNQGFEKLLNDLDMLHRIKFLRSERLAGLQATVCQLRAQANREFLGILHEREAANAGHFEQLRRECDSATRETAAE